MITPELLFEKPTMEHCKLYHTWTNDPEVRKNSFNTTNIPYENHLKWFAKKIASESCIMYIVSHEGRYIGQARIEIEGEEGEISYSVAKESRHNGYGTKIISMLPSILLLSKEDRIKRLVGKVKYENFASRRCFEHCSYAEINTQDYVEYSCII